MNNIDYELNNFILNPLEYLNKYSNSDNKYDLLLNSINTNIKLLSKDKQNKINKFLKKNNINKMSGGNENDNENGKVINNKKVSLMVYINLIIDYIYNINNKIRSFSNKLEKNIIKNEKEYGVSYTTKDRVSFDKDNTIKQKYILLAFLGGLPNDKHWEAFMSTVTDKCIIVLHPMDLEKINETYWEENRFWKKFLDNKKLIIVDKEHHVKTGWATRSLVDAHLLMMQYALLTKGNIFKKVILLSGNCYPLYNFNVIYNELFKDCKSWIYINDESYSRFHNKLFYDYEGGKFSIDNYLYMSQWNILDYNHLIYYFEYDENIDEFKKTYKKNIKNQVDCNNSIELIEAINPKLNFQHYLISMYGSFDNNIDNFIDKINKDINNGFCVSADEHLIGSILLFNLDSNYDKSIIENIKTFKIDDLINVSDKSFIKENTDKLINIEHPFEVFDPHLTAGGNNNGYLNINRLWFGNRFSINKHNVKKKITFFVNKKLEYIIKNIINNFINKVKNNNITNIDYNKIKNINIQYLTFNYPEENTIIPKDLENNFKLLNDDLQNELTLIIKYLLTTNEAYIIITKQGLKYVSIDFIKNTCNEASIVYNNMNFVDIDNNYDDNKFKNILKNADTYYEENINTFSNIKLSNNTLFDISGGGVYNNLSIIKRINYEELNKSISDSNNLLPTKSTIIKEPIDIFPKDSHYNNDSNNGFCYIGYKKGYVFDNIYTIASTYTDWSIVSFDPFNLFRNFDILSLLDNKYNNINSISDNNIIKLYEICKSRQFLNFDTFELYSLLNNINNINNVINFNSNNINILGPTYHPAEYYSWNLIHIINAYNIIVFFKLYNKSSWNDIFKICLKNYSYHINKKINLLNTHTYNKSEYNFYTIKSEFINSNIITKNNYGYIITSNILNNALAHGSLFIRKVLGKDSNIHLYTDDLMKLEHYVHDYNIESVPFRKIYNYTDMIYDDIMYSNNIIPKMNPFIPNNYESINNLFKEYLNYPVPKINSFISYAKNKEYKYYKNNTLLKLNNIFDNYKITIHTNTKDHLKNKNYIFINHDYFKKINAISKIYINPYDENNNLISNIYESKLLYNETLIYNYLFKLDNILKKYIKNHIVIPLDIFYIPMKYFKIYFKDNCDVNLLIKKNEVDAQKLHSANFIILKTYDLTFNKYIINIINDNKSDTLKYIIFDIFYAIHLLNNKLNIIHNDLHHKNILINLKPCKMRYLLNGNIYTRKSTYSIGLFDFYLSNMNKITDIHTKEYSSRGIFNIKYGTMVDIFLLLIQFFYIMHYDKYNNDIDKVDEKYYVNFDDIEKIFNGTYNDTSKSVYYELSKILQVIFKNIPSEITEVIKFSIDKFKDTTWDNMYWPTFCKNIKNSKECVIPIEQIFDGTQLLNELIKYNNITLKKKN